MTDPVQGWFFSYPKINVTMKNIITILLVAILMSSCGPEPTVQKKDLPIEVVILKETKTFDTLYSIQTDSKTFYFDKKEEYLGAINNKDETGTLILLVFIVAFFIGLTLTAAVYNAS